MDSIGFKIGSPLEEISRIKVGTPTAEHPVVPLSADLVTEITVVRWIFFPWYKTGAILVLMKNL